MIIGLVGKKIWDLKVALKGMLFLWLTFKGRISTADYLYSINMGPRSFCAMCNLEVESIEHLLYSCCNIHAIWNQIRLKMGFDLSSFNAFCNGGLSC